MNEFTDIVVGDNVTFEDWNCCKVFDVTEVTEDTITAGGEVFSKKDGNALKGTAMIYPATEEEIQMAEHSELVEEIEELLKRVNFRTFSLGYLRILRQVLKGA